LTVISTEKVEMQGFVNNNLDYEDEIEIENRKNNLQAIVEVDG